MATRSRSSRVVLLGLALFGALVAVSRGYADGCHDIDAMRGQLRAARQAIEQEQLAAPPNGAVGWLTQATQAIGQAAAILAAATEPAELLQARRGLTARLTRIDKTLTRAALPTMEAAKKGKLLRKATRGSDDLTARLTKLFQKGGCTTIGVALNPSLGDVTLFPSDNWWNVPVTNWPVAANSDAVIDYIGRTRGLHPDVGTDFGIPYLTVGGAQPRLSVVFGYADQSDTAAPRGPAGYPIPEEAKTRAGYIEGGIPGGGPDGDRHMLIVDRDSHLLFELFALHWTGSRWEAGSGAIFDLDSNHRRPEGWTSADAAGLAMLPGLVRADEVFERREIAHAIRFTAHGTQGYVFPASHDATHGPGGNARPPLGTRVRLKSSFDISSFAPEVQVILRAMKTYGMILADNGSDWFFQGAPDPRWNDELMHDEFLRVKGGDFEVVSGP